MVAKTPEYLVNHGKTGALGRFTSVSFERFARGERVVLESVRGLTVGVVVCEANERHARLLAHDSPGRLLRRVDANDQARERDNRQREQQVFEASRKAAEELGLPMEILDSELSLDGSHVIVQYLLAESCDPQVLMTRLAAQFGAEVWLENLATKVAEETGGCGEPNCGRKDGGSGCDSCGSGGGCTSCGSGKVDMRAYFGHLREKMEETRTPLL